MNRKGNRRTKVVLALTMLAVMFAVGVVNASATVYDYRTNLTYDTNGRIYQSLGTVTNKNLAAYSRSTVTVGGRTLSVKGFTANGVSYIPFRAASSAISGSSYSYNSATRTSVMRASGLEITSSDGCYVTYANGRALFATTPAVIMSDGRLYIPASIFAKAVGMSLSSSGGVTRISGGYSPLIPGERFYREDEVFWLARIIHAESKGEPLLGQIAVGNVVLNRVRSAYYPGTIYGVIFVRKYGVQFSPVLDGSIYNTPGYNSTLAAKICLEGSDISGGAFFFLNTRLATSSWIPKTREYAFTIGNHDFYK